MNAPDRNSQLGWEAQGASSRPDLRDSYEDSAPLFLDKLNSLAEAEKLFDELTQEKLQVGVLCEGRSQLITSHPLFPLVNQTFFMNSADEVAHWLCLKRLQQNNSNPHLTSYITWSSQFLSHSSLTSIFRKFISTPPSPSVLLVLGHHISQLTNLIRSSQSV